MHTDVERGRSGHDEGRGYRRESDHTIALVPTLPEGEDQFMERCWKVMKSFNARYPFRSKTTLLIVSHAAGCVSLSHVATGMLLDPHHDPNGGNGYVGHMDTLGETHPALECVRHEGRSPHGIHGSDRFEVGDIHKFTTGLAEACKTRGVNFIYGADIGYRKGG